MTCQTYKDGGLGAATKVKFVRKAIISPLMLLIGGRVSNLGGVGYWRWLEQAKSLIDDLDI